MALQIMDQPAGYFFYLSFWKLIDLLYPPYCSGCGHPGIRWCSKCQNSFEKPGLNICPICGLPQSDKSICSDCKTETPPFEQLRSCGIFDGPLRQAIHRLKYNRDLGIGEMLSRYIIDEYLLTNWLIDMITCVPATRQRLVRQGYNHASVLTRPVSIYTGIPFKPGALKRQKESSKQVGRSLIERMENVRGAFKATTEIVSGKSIMIVDDVITTTATMQACANALKLAGARHVYGLSLARTRLKIERSYDNNLIRIK